MFTTTSKKSDLFGIHYTTCHTAKMSGLHSLSTSVNSNPYCEKRRANGSSICSKCFAATMTKRYSNLDKALQENAKILSSGLIPWENIPLTPTRLFRFEAFGDLINWIQVVNYFRICEKNPDTCFALWTKNPQIIARAINEGYNKPNNIEIVLSSSLINKPIKSTRYDFIDKIFTVYDKKGAKDVAINCGARSCLACGRCYRKNPEGIKIQYINELLK